MKCAPHSPAYLVRNPHSYCFRLVIPVDLRPVVGKAEIRCSLRTGYIGQAKQRARFLAAQIQSVFRLLRRGSLGMGKLTADHVKQLVAAHIRKSIERLDSFFEDDGLEECSPIQDADDLYAHISNLNIIREDLVEHLNLGDYSMLEGTIDTLLKENGVNEVDKSSPTYRRLCVAIHKAETQLIPIQQQHRLCDFSYRDRLPKLFPEAFPATDKQISAPQELPAKQQRNSVSVQRVFSDYWREKEPTLKGRSATEVRRALDHFIEFVGKGTDIRALNAEMLIQYKQRLLKEEVSPRKTRSSKTINDKYLTFVRGFLGYCKRHSYLTENPAEGLLIKERKTHRPDEEREAFSIQDLQAIFCDSEEFGSDQMNRPYRFWMPLIGLYTGMRIEEISQLYISDLKQIDGLWCLDVNEDKPDKSVKTSERRLVPLHPFLAEDLSFIRYVQSLPDQNGRIFPELTRIKNRYSHYATAWFSQFRRKCGVTGKKGFHSFRHLVTDHLFKQDVPERVISMLVGHALKGETGGRYGKRYEPKRLYEKAVLKLDYGLDLSHLKNSKWVVR